MPDRDTYPLPASLFPIAESVSAGVALHRGGKILFANRTMSRLTGYTPAELMALDYCAFFQPSMQQHVREQAEAHLRQDGVPAVPAPPCETAIITQAGELRWVELSISHQEVLGERTVIGCFIDITERKNAEMELRAMHADLEAKVTKRTAQLLQAKATLEQDIARRETAETELLKRYAELTELNCRLQETQQQLVQSEKLASIGQLAAGVAHEINNPIGYVNSNIRSLKDYVTQILEVLDVYESCEAALPDEARQRIRTAKQAADFDFLREDIGQLISESREGTERVRKIVQDLRDFSRADTSQEWQAADLHHGLDSTLNIASNEIKYKADVVREYGSLPLVECLLPQLNQVFMNLFVNAAQAMPDGRRGTITVRTGTAGEEVWIEVADNGSGMPPDVRDRIFDPFFTTKPVGKGTGLGLSLSYGIIQKHQGQIAVSSTPGIGTTFRITLPIRHQAPAGAPQ